MISNRLSPQAEGCPEPQPYCPMIRNSFTFPRTVYKARVLFQLFPRHPDSTVHTITSTYSTNSTMKLTTLTLTLCLQVVGTLAKMRTPLLKLIASIHAKLHLGKESGLLQWQMLYHPMLGCVQSQSKHHQVIDRAHPPRTPPPPSPSPSSTPTPSPTTNTIPNPASQCHPT